MPSRIPLGLTALLAFCGCTDDPTVEQRYVGDLVERCATGFGQTLGTRPAFELVLSTEDETHYQTNIPICEPDAVTTAPGTLGLSESSCFRDEEGETVGEYHVVEGEVVIDGDTASLRYRWTGPGYEGGPMSSCEVDNVLMRVE